MNDEPHVSRYVWGYAVDTTEDRVVAVMRKEVTGELYCRACEVTARDPCWHIQQVVAFIHRKQGTV